MSRIMPYACYMCTVYSVQCWLVPILFCYVCFRHYLWTICERYAWMYVPNRRHKTYSNDLLISGKDIGIFFSLIRCFANFFFPSPIVSFIFHFLFVSIYSSIFGAAVHVAYHIRHTLYIYQYERPIDVCKQHIYSDEPNTSKYSF